MHATKAPVSNPISQQFRIPHVPGEEGQLLIAVLEYLTEGIVPLLHAFYTLFFDSVECSEEQHVIELEVSASIANALFVSSEVMLWYMYDCVKCDCFCCRVSAMTS